MIEEFVPPEAANDNYGPKIANKLLQAIIDGEFVDAKKLQTEVGGTTDNNWSERVYPLAEDIRSFVKEVEERFKRVEEQEAIKEVLRFMLEIHIDQKNRIDGSTTISHTLGVAKSFLFNYEDASSEEVQAALLHDSIEDQQELLEKHGEDLKLIQADEKYPRGRARAYIHSKTNAKTVNLVHGLTSPLPYPHDTDGDGTATFIAVAQKADEYRDHMRHLLESEDPGLISIKWADAKENMPLIKLKNLIVIAREAGDKKALSAYERKVASLRRKYEPVLRNEWLPFWEKVKKDEEGPLYSQSDGALDFIARLLEGDYKSQSA